MNCVLLVKPLYSHVFRAVSGLKSPKSRKTIPKTLMLWIGILSGKTIKVCTAVRKKGISNEREAVTELRQNSKANQPNVAACNELREALAEKRHPEGKAASDGKMAFLSGGCAFSHCGVIRSVSFEKNEKLPI